MFLLPRHSLFSKGILGIIFFPWCLPWFRCTGHRNRYHLQYHAVHLTRSSPAPTTSLLLHSCPSPATYWRMCKCCVTSLLTYILIIYRWHCERRKITMKLRVQEKIDIDSLCSVLWLKFRVFHRVCQIVYTAPAGSYKQVSIQFSFYKILSCDPGYSLLSCGIDNSQLDSMECYRTLNPINSTSCQCYDWFGAKCVASCYSGSVDDFQIVGNPAIGSLTGDVIATCPTGTFVIGCHPNPNQQVWPGHDEYRRYYPSSNTGCTCEDKDGIQCIATCASNVRNHEIVTTTGSGTFQAVCSPSNFALGCGMNTTGEAPDKFRTAFVVSSTACQCLDQFGTTCYAICGQLYWSLSNNMNQVLLSGLANITTVCIPELSTGRMDPRVGSGRVGSRFCRILAGRVGSGQNFGFFSISYWLFIVCLNRYESSNITFLLNVCPI